jgi:hypothetical protein
VTLKKHLSKIVANTIVYKYNDLVKKFKFKSIKYFFIFLKSENNFFIKQNSSGSFLDIKLFYKGISVRI